ncbi:DUF2341 domain-containing protein [Thermofilum sp.]|jgi:hypothetical protein|uniref:DUF2341 domain-containing protein n=1 Tax=Thermofilum sp. TaxID=1961369 RepID=UPI002587B75B|nr:DUF2341 domain-containing protein [Thermofilum sp.]
MRHLEALAIGLIYVLTLVLLYSYASMQSTPVHHVSVERAVAYALLACQNQTCFTDTLRRVAGSELSALFVNGTLVTLKPGTALGYSAIIYTPIITSVTPPSPQNTPWWDKQWSYTRKITVTNTAPASTWWNTAWLYRVPVTITSGASYTNQQIQIYFNTQAPISTGKMRSDCGDIRVVDSDDATQLPYWIEPGTCNKAPYTIIWVKVPSIPAGTKTIYIYYGNPSATGQSDVNSVFFAVIPNLKALFRLDEDSSSSITYPDPASTIGSPVGTLQNGPTWVQGKYKYALSFDGVDDYVNFGNILNLAGKSLTISAWIKVNQLPPSGYTYPFVARRQTSGSYNADYLVEVTSGGGICFTYAKAGTYNWYGSCTGGGIITAGQWFHVVAVFDSSSTTAKIYVNAVQKASQNTGQQLTSNSGAVFRLAYTWDTGTNKYYNGVLDEIAVFDRALTDSEISALYSYYAYGTQNYAGYLLMGNPPASVTVSIGSEIIQPAKPVPLTDYQVPLVIDTSSLILTGKLRSDCGDIRFVASDNQTLLPYFIDPGTCGTTSTRIWVKVPSIPAYSSTYFFMYYGNPSATSQSTPSALFIYEPFTTQPSGTLAGSASYVSASKYVQLTPTSTNQLGYLYYSRVPTSPQGFYARFYFWIGGGSGADALWLGAYDASYSGTSEDVVNGGYHFTFDEYQDRIAFTKSTTGNGNPIASATQTDLDNSQWRLAEVYFWYDGTKACAQIFLDGAQKLYACDAQVQPNVASGTGQFIFGGRTGGSTNYHRIGNAPLLVTKFHPTVSVSVGPEAAKPLSPAETGNVQLPQVVVVPKPVEVRVGATP